MSVATIEIPEAVGFLFDPPFGDVRYRVGYGGRGGAKSWNFARATLILGSQRPLRILCAREYQSSIKESVHKLLSDQIALMELDGFYIVQQTSIKGLNGTEFIFKGIRHDPGEIKSTEGVDLCWVEEAESVSEQSWRVLIPTIRKEPSEIWVTFNPAMATDPTYKRFVTNPSPRAIVRHLSWRDNPWLPTVLREEREELLRTDPEVEAHIWGGEPWMRSDAQVLAGKYEVRDLEPQPHWDGPYFGADWGFARDPTVLTKQWLADNRLLIEYDERGVGWSMDNIARRFDRVPDSRKHTIWGDSSRPETINEISERGFKVRGAPAWTGSVEDGVEHLRSYEKIVIHPRCKGWIEEARLWSYKTDPRTGDVLPKLKDGFDHGPDSTRYAINKIIKRRHTKARVM